MDRLEAAGYLRTDHDRDTGVGAAAKENRRDDVNVNMSDDVAARKLEEEEVRFQRELAMQDLEPEQDYESFQPHQQKATGPRKVEIEEVQDEDA